MHGFAKRPEFLNHVSKFCCLREVKPETAGHGALGMGNPWTSGKRRRHGWTEVSMMGESRRFNRFEWGGRPRRAVTGEGSVVALPEAGS